MKLKSSSSSFLGAEKSINALFAKAHAFASARPADCFPKLTKINKQVEKQRDTTRQWEKNKMDGWLSASARANTLAIKI